MKHLVKLVAVVAVVFQADAMEVQKEKNDNLNANSLQPVTEGEDSNETNNQLEYLRELDKNIYAILNNTTPDQAPEPTNEELIKIKSEVDAILGKNSEDK